MAGQKLGWIGASILCLCLGACRCGDQHDTAQPHAGLNSGKTQRIELVDLTTLIPDSVHLAFLSDQPYKVWTWLNQKPWFQKMKESPVWSDLLLSGPIYEWITAKHKLISASPATLQHPNLEEFLSTPLALAIERDSDDFKLLLVKQIDLRIKAIQSMVEVYSKVQQGPKIEEVTLAGHDVKVVRLAKTRKAFFLINGNLMMLSTDAGLLQKAIVLASKQKKNYLARYQLLERFRKQHRDLLMYLNPHSFSNWAWQVTPVERLVLGWSVGDPPQTALLAKTRRSSRTFSVAPALRMVPLDSHIVIGRAGFPWVTIWKQWEHNFEATSKAQKRMLRNIRRRLFAKLTGEVLLVVDKIQEGPNPFPELAVLAKAQNDRITSMVSTLFPLFFGSKVQKHTLLQVNNHTIFSALGGQLEPAFTTIDDWLVVASSQEMVTKIVKTAFGQSPAISDLSGLRSHLPEGDYLGWVYVDGVGFFEDANAFCRSIVNGSERFDANDVDDTLTPFFQAVKQIGKVSAYLQRDQGAVVTL